MKFLAFSLNLFLLFFASAAQKTSAENITFQSPSIDTESLKAHVKHLSVDLYPRSYDHHNLNLAADYIFSAFKASGGQASVQEFTVQAKTYKNILVRFGPAAGPVLVIGAHYDSHGDTPGADDNASGVAGLIELANLLGKNSPQRPVELVAFTLEEPPYFRTAHMGSAHHAQALRESKQEVALMLSLEMIGYFSEQPNSQSYPHPSMAKMYSDRGDFIALIGRMENFSSTERLKKIMAGATDLPVYSINAPASLRGIDFSDHLNYWNQGFSAFMISDTSFMRNPNYHQTSDTYDTLDYFKMAKVVQAVYAITQHY